MAARSVEDQIIELQEKLLHQDDTIVKLDAVVTRQYNTIEALTRRVKLLEDKLDALRNEMQRQPFSAADEKPPHY